MNALLSITVCLYISDVCVCVRVLIREANEKNGIVELLWKEQRKELEKEVQHWRMRAQELEKVRLIRNNDTNIHH